MKALVAILLLCPAAAAAQDVDCENASMQMELTYCAEQAWLQADAELNDVYADARALAKELDAALPSDQRGIAQALLDGQRAWVTFRDKSCEAEAGVMRGGSAEPMLIYGCWERLTWVRAEDLAGFVETVDQ